MTATPNPATTLQDLVTKLDQTLEDNDRFKADNDRFKAELDKFNDRFKNYQKATQWIVQLAFTLIASATITVIITSIFRK